MLFRRKAKARQRRTNRLEKGIAVQSDIFGKDHIEKMRQNAPQELRHIQDYLSANCFGDYYTRTGLDIPTRELLTFTVLVAMGGCGTAGQGSCTG